MFDLIWDPKEVGKILRQAVAGTGKKISLELGGKLNVMSKHIIRVTLNTEFVTLWFVRFSTSGAQNF